MGHELYPRHGEIGRIRVKLENGVLTVEVS